MLYYWYSAGKVDPGILMHETRQGSNWIEHNSRPDQICKFLLQQPVQNIWIPDISIEVVIVWYLLTYYYTWMEMGKKREGERNRETKSEDLGLENKTLTKNQVISGEISLFPVCSSTKV